MDLISIFNTNAQQIWSKNPNYLFEGTTPGEAGSILHITFDNISYQIKLDAQGHWEWQIPADLPEGPHTITFFYVDLAGNVGDAAQVIFNLDFSAPDKPEILKVYDDVGAEQHNLTSGDTSDDLKPKIIGVAEPGSTISIYDGRRLLGTAKADSNGRWEFQAELEPGNHEITVTATDRHGHVSQPSDPFILILIEPSDDGSNEDLKITHALDNYGDFTGKLAGGSITDDRTPTLYGEGKAGDTAYLYYRTMGSSDWLLIESVTIDAFGKWMLDSDRLPAGQYQFTASYNAASPEGNDIFDLQIIVPNSFIPVIVDAWDNAGLKMGILTDGQETDDNTPQLRGYAEANSLVYVRYYSDSQPDDILYGSTTANMEGNWLFTPPVPLSHDNWHFSAGNSIADSEMGTDFSLNIVNFERINTLYDFNDIERILVTNRVAELVYQDLTFTNLTPGVKDSGLYTDTWPKQGNLGVMMQTPAFSKTVEYLLTFKHKVEKISFTAVDWKMKSCYVAFYDDEGVEVGRVNAKTSGVENKEYFTFSSDVPFTSMKIHMQNLGGYSRIDDIEVDYLVERTSTVYDFNDIEYIPVVHAVTEIVYRDITFTDLNLHEGKPGLYTDYWPAQNNLGIMMNSPAYNIPAEYLVQFKQGATQVSFTAMDWKSKSSYVAFYDESGSEVGRVYAKTSGVKNTEYFTFSSDVPFTSMKIHLQNLGGYSRLDNLQVDYQLDGAKKTSDVGEGNHAAPGTFEYMLLDDEFNGVTLKIDDAQYHLQRDALNESTSTIARFDMKNSGETKLSVDLKELLSTGSENLYIDDGRKQLMISGDKGDVLEIKGVNDGNTLESWQQSGKVTVAGINYDVYLAGQDNEILIEEGIITQTY